jgi:putative endonuclease
LDVPLPHLHPSSPSLTGRTSIPETVDVASQFYVYIRANRIGGTLYIGVTNDLVRRVGEHKLKLIEGFTEKYNVVRLVYFEQFDDPESAIKREKRLKKWNRAMEPGMEDSFD